MCYICSLCSVPPIKVCHICSTCGAPLIVKRTTHERMMQCLNASCMYVFVNICIFVSVYIRVCMCVCVAYVPCVLYHSSAYVFVFKCIVHDSYMFFVNMCIFMSVHLRVCMRDMCAVCGSPLINESQRGGTRRRTQSSATAWYCICPLFA